MHALVCHASMGFDGRLEDSVVEVDRAQWNMAEGDREATKMKRREQYETDAALRASALESLSAALEKDRGESSLVTSLQGNRELLLQFLRAKAYDEKKVRAFAIDMHESRHKGA